MASACGRWSSSLRPIYEAGPGTSETVKRPRCCKPLKRGYAADFGRWCGSNGSRDERDFASFANGASVRTWRHPLPAVLMARGESQTRPLCTLPYPMPTLPSSGFRPWSYVPSLIRRTAVCGPACTVVREGRTGDCSPYPDQVRVHPWRKGDYTVATPRISPNPPFCALRLFIGLRFPFYKKTELYAICTQRVQRKSLVVELFASPDSLAHRLHFLSSKMSRATQVHAVLSWLSHRPDIL